MENALPARSRTPLFSHPWAWAVVLGIYIAVFYANSFNGVFLYDDVRAIERNESLRHLSSPWRVLTDPENITRPVVALTFAIDYALYGLHPAGFHVVNLVAHLAAALLLFGIVRRSLLSEKLRDRYGPAASQLAAVAALIWAAHPLQTESVTYVVQRAESMMGMFFLLALYCAIRGANSRSKTTWHACAIAAAILGAGSKQVIVALPVMVLLYDRCFVSGSFKAALKRAPGLYAGLCLCWLIVAALLVSVPHVTAAGFGMEKVKWYNYAASQCVVIAHYLRLAIWPANLCLDYAWNVERDLSRIIPAALLLAALVGAALWKLWKNTPAGFCGAWFFVILGPTSSVLPIADLAVEHRMYLSLAALTVLFATIIYQLMQHFFKSSANPLIYSIRATVAICSLVGAVLGIATKFRNVLYSDKIAMFEDVIAKRPNNPRAIAIVGMDALERRDFVKAGTYIDRVIALRPNLPETHYMKATVLYAQNDFQAAIAAFENALRINLLYKEAWKGLASAWIERDKNNKLIQQKASTLMRAPQSVGAHLDMGGALAIAKRFDDAVFEYDTVLKLQPNHDDAAYYRGKAFELSGNETNAVAAYRVALSVNADRPLIGNALAWIEATSSNDQVRNGSEAVQWAERACAKTQFKQPLFLDTLAAAYAEAGQFEKAAATAESALKLAGNDAGLAKEIHSHLAFYNSGKPFRQARPD